ncbi:MAG: hypothetical protein KDC35_18055 [Acidobacteria bacterium]|nr:hypothetical protein [Acidobacteriota bacterium]
MRRFGFTCFSFVLMAVPVFAQFINIPDPNFKACILSTWDTNMENEISLAEAALITSLDCQNQAITDIEGVVTG